MKRILPIQLAFFLFLSACDGVFSTFNTPVSGTQPSALETTPAPTEMQESTRTPLGVMIAEVATPSVEVMPEQVSGLKIWLPPQFDPNANTPAGKMLAARLQSFVDEHPGIQIEVRIKALEGTGGLLDSLVTASAAAPDALPDLVALPRPLLEKAALRGLVYSLDGLSKELEQEDWYEYARELAHLQQSTFGLPFAGDALILVYQPAEGVKPPKTWSSVLEEPGALVFAASDPEALFTLAQYQSAGGEIQDEQGRPALEAKILEAVLTIYTNAVQAGRISDRLSQISTQEQAWQAFQEGQFTMAVTWASSYLTAQDSAAILMPTPQDQAYTLATGWLWAIASPKSQRRVLSAALAEYLVEIDFLARWSEANAFLPPRANAVELWQTEATRTLVNDLSQSAHLVPAGDVISSLGPVLQQAVLQVLRQEKTPSEAAQAAIESLGAR